ncbi:DUF3606 domain-containing protein [Pedobacter aquatilis]|uniref:DUF3606 domain-containing protein n=1 Tax=Pedobacter aquatilis TaxID=351343 RepID=UPI002930CB0E|nr:DUF3606 domain-containing protein [Pedobacter aquatilis]
MINENQNPPQNPGVPDPEEIRSQHPIEDDHDSLEAMEATASAEINPEDPQDIAYWAMQFQISEDELRAAILLRGTAVEGIRKYLSV